MSGKSPEYDGTEPPPASGPENSFSMPGVTWMAATDGKSIGRRLVHIRRGGKLPRAIDPADVVVPDGYAIDPETGVARRLPEAEDSP